MLFIPDSSIEGEQTDNCHTLNQSLCIILHID